MMISVHESAIVDDGAKIGNGTRIWHFTHVCSGAVIGNNCSLGQNVFIGNNVNIGNNVKIQNNVSVYDSITLEDDVFCGPSMVFTNVYNPRSHIVRKQEYRKTRVQKGATIGANATVICGVVIGRYAFIGAGSVVNCDVRAYSVMVGVPAKHIGWMCECGVGLKLNTEQESICSRCSITYKLRDGNCERV